MKRKTISEAWSAPVYAHPCIAVLELASEQILCGSDWNDGSVDDNEDNWNTLPTL